MSEIKTLWDVKFERLQFTFSICGKVRLDNSDSEARGTYLHKIL